MFITIVGVDGSGKSTISKMIYDWLTTEKKLESTLTRLPGGTPIGTEIREIVLNINLDPYTSLHLFAADRRQHRVDVIEPAIEGGEIVICDRYWYCDYAYNVYPQKDQELTFFFNDLIELEESPVPDLVIWLDPPLNDCLSRIEGEDKYESRGRDYYENVQKGYKEILSPWKDKYRELGFGNSKRFPIHPKDTLEKMFADIKLVIEGLLGKDND